MSRPHATPPPTLLRDAETQALRAALAGHQGSRQDQARQLGIGPRTLYRKLRGPDGVG